MRRLDEITVEYVELIPETQDMRHGVLYVSKEHSVASHLCACGCGNETVTPLHRDWWVLCQHNGAVSLTPSIGNFRFACKSHYYIRENKIDWC